MSDKDREYEEIMKLFEQKYPESTNSDRQRQPQSRYSADCPVSQRTPQQRTATAQPSRQTVNNRTYTRQHIPQKRRTPKKRKQRRLLGISAAVLAIILLAVLKHRGSYCRLILKHPNAGRCGSHPPPPCYFFGIFQKAIKLLLLTFSMTREYADNTVVKNGITPP